jgi:hypothetical protein
VEDIITNATNDLKTIPLSSFEHCSQNGKADGRGAFVRIGTLMKEIIFNEL